MPAVKSGAELRGELEDDDDQHGECQGTGDQRRELHGTGGVPVGAIGHGPGASAVSSPRRLS